MTIEGKEIILTFENEISSITNRMTQISYAKYFEELINQAEIEIVSSLNKEAIFSYCAVAKFSAAYWEQASTSSNSPWAGPLNVYDGGEEMADRLGCYAAFVYCTNNPNNPMSTGWGNGANHCCGLGSLVASASYRMVMMMIL